MPHMHDVSGFVAQGTPIRQALSAFGSLIRPKAAPHRKPGSAHPQLPSLIWSQFNKQRFGKSESRPTMPVHGRHVNQAV